MQPSRPRPVQRSAVMLVAVMAGSLLAGCGGTSSTPTSGVSTTSGEPDLPAGQELFSRKCGICHTLEDARTEGTLGPNLDTLQPSMERTRRQIEDGGGAMPKDLVTGQDAEDVAAYVAEVAGTAEAEGSDEP